MSNAASEAVIQEYCRELKLAAVVRDYPGLCRRARDGGWAYEDLLRELLEAEITNRHQSTARRLLREARFPDIKTLDQLDWSQLKGVSRPKLMELVRRVKHLCRSRLLFLPVVARLKGPFRPDNIEGGRGDTETWPTTLGWVLRLKKGGSAPSTDCGKSFIGHPC